MATRNAASVRSTVSTVRTRKGIYLDGVTGSLSIPDNDAYSAVTTGSITISVWINPSSLTMPTVSSTNHYVHLLSKTNASQAEWAFRMYQQPPSSDGDAGRVNRLSYYFFNLSGGEGAAGDSQDVITPGQWIHCIAIADGTNCYFYKNGRLRAFQSYASFSVAPSNGTAPIRAGVARSGDGVFQGKIDDLRIWNRVLNEDEIKDLYNNGKDIQSGLVGWWKLDEGTGSVATDSSSLVNNGTITTPVWNTLEVEKRTPAYRGNPTRFVASQVSDKTNTIVTRPSILTMSQSLSLDGTTQYASITHANQSGLDVGLSDFMVGGWFKIKDNGAFQHLISKYSGASLANSSSGLGYELMYRGDTTQALTMRINDGSASGTSVAPSFSVGGNFATGSWHHAAAFVDRSDQAYLFVDGYYQTNSTISTRSNTITNTGNFIIGRESGTGTSGFMNGSVRDVFLCNFGVGGFVGPYPDFTEIATYVRNIVFRGVYPSQTVSHWTLDNTVSDSIGSNHLALTGSPTYSTDVPSISRSTV